MTYELSDFRKGHRVVVVDYVNPSRIGQKGTVLGLTHGATRFVKVLLDGDQYKGTIPMLFKPGELDFEGMAGFKPGDRVRLLKWGSAGRSSQFAGRVGTVVGPTGGGQFIRVELDAKDMVGHLACLASELNYVEKTKVYAIASDLPEWEADILAGAINAGALVHVADVEVV